VCIIFVFVRHLTDTVINNSTTFPTFNLEDRVDLRGGGIVKNDNNNNNNYYYYNNNNNNKSLLVYQRKSRDKDNLGVMFVVIN
jgi:hypothetical protein